MAVSGLEWEAQPGSVVKPQAESGGWGDCKPREGQPRGQVVAGSGVQLCGLRTRVHLGSPRVCVGAGWAGGTCSAEGQASSGLHPGPHQKPPNMFKLGVQ